MSFAKVDKLGCIKEKRHRRKDDLFDFDDFRHFLDDDLFDRYLDNSDDFSRRGSGSLWLRRRSDWFRRDFFNDTIVLHGLWLGQDGRMWTVTKKSFLRLGRTD